MHSKQNTIRVLGQRSIPSSFIFRSSNPGAIDSNQEGQKEDSKKNPRISFSDFLDKKLHKSPVVHKTVKGKSRPFWTPLGPPINGGGFTDHQNEVQKEKEERSFVLDDLVFQQFKPTSVEKGDDVISVGDGEKRDGMGPFSKKRNSSSAFGIGSSGDCDFGTSITSFVKGSNHVGEVGISTVNDVPGSRKRNLFEEPYCTKAFISFGSSSKSRSKRKKRKLHWQQKTKASLQSLCKRFWLVGL
uniref:Uncharacterized protein n=1 Tax=Salix viminalis TaxID=40686 RepID=A0A6N2JY32_SALVM